MALSDFSLDSVPRVLDVRVRYDVVWDRVEVFLLNRNRDGKLLEIGQPVVMVPYEQGQEHSPTIALATSQQAGAFIDAIVNYRRGYSTPPGGTDGRVSAMQRHLEDLRHLLKITGVERLESK